MKERWFAYIILKTIQFSYGLITCLLSSNIQNEETNIMFQQLRKARSAIKYNDLLHINHESRNVTIVNLQFHKAQAIADRKIKLT